jgi:hypothetical protein
MDSNDSDRSRTGKETVQDVLCGRVPEDAVKAASSAHPLGGCSRSRSC